MILLNELEVRVVGSLIEKQISTPEYYPMTLNALTAACNQKNNREPVVSFDDTTVVRGLDSLREKALIATVTGAGMRVPKYRQKITEALELSDQQTAIMCILMLRGPQTYGELRSRSGHLFDFKSIEEVESVVQALMERQPDKLIALVPKQPGQKEVRFGHLLCGEPVYAPQEVEVRPEPARLQILQENERITQLEETVKNLQTSISTLQKQFAEFKKQFE